ncbi:MAG: hypothetical protein HRU26_00905 [Psychroserpens sp.]|nr:hypothetical protein [Psychroserpens sp.]
MEVSEIITYVLTILLPALGTWVNKMQHQIFDLKTAIAVNTSKDEEIWTHVQKMESKLDKLIESVSDIKQSIAEIRASS